VERLEDRCVPSANFNLVQQDLDVILNNYQNVVTGGVLGAAIPLIGTALKNTPEAQFITSIRSAVDTELTGVTLSSAADVQQHLYHAFTTHGLSLLASQSDIHVVTHNDSDVEFTMHLTQSQGILGSTEAFQFDTALPGLGLTASAPGGVRVALGYGMDLNFGVTDQDVYLDTAPSGTAGQHPLSIQVTASLPPGPNGQPATLQGKLAFLNVQLTDGSPGSTFTGALSLDLHANDGSDRVFSNDLRSQPLSQLAGTTVGIDGSGDLNFHVDVNVGGSAEFPSFGSDLTVHWPFHASLTGDVPTAQFSNVHLNLGTFFSQFAAPVLSEIQTAFKPLKPVFDTLMARLPVVSDLAGHSVTLMDLVSGVSSSAQNLLQAVTDIDKLITSIPTDAGNLVIQFGSFDLGGADIRSSGATLSSHQTQTAPSVQSQLSSFGAAGVNSSSFFAQTEGTALEGFKLNLFDHPEDLFGLFLGKDADLFSYTPPDLDLDFKFSQSFPIIPPILSAQIAGDIQAKTHIEFGYDTYGFTHGDPFQGFFIRGPQGGQPGAGLQLSGSFLAGASFNALIAQASVTGGIVANVNFTLHDPNNDGKVRPSEIASDLAKGPLALFDVSGEVDAVLQATLQVGVEVFGHLIGYQQTFDLADVKLLDFGGANVSDDNVPPAAPPLATFDATTGVLTLNMGPNAGARTGGNTTDGDEDFTVTPFASLPDGTQVVIVGAFGQAEIFPARKIYAEGGLGNDTITIEPGVTVPVELWGDFNPVTHPGHSGDFGNDVLTASVGPAVLHGGGGDDQLVAGSGDAQMFGDSGNDVLIGGAGQDFLSGNDGDDRIYGGSGPSTLVGGAGSDYIQAGIGDEQMWGGDYASSSDDGSTDTFVVTTPSANLLQILTSNLSVNGAFANDSVLLQGNNGTLTQTYSVDPTIGTATFVATAQSSRQTLTVSGTPAIFDTMPTDSLNVNGSSTSDTIQLQDLGAVGGVTLSEVTIDAFGPLYFANAGSVAINGEAGNDSITVDDATPATGLTQLTVDGGTDNDTITILNIPLLSQGVSLSGGLGTADTLTASIAGNLGGTVNVSNFETSTIQLSPSAAGGGDGSLTGTLSVSGPLQDLEIAGSLTGSVTVSGLLGTLNVGKATPGVITAGDIHTVLAAAATGPEVLQIVENGVTRRLDVGAVGLGLPVGLTFRYFYDSTAAGDPQLAVRVTNSQGRLFDLNLVTLGDAAFNLARLDTPAQAASGVRDLSVEGSLLSTVTPAAASFLGLRTGSPGGVILPLDKLGSVAVRDNVRSGTVAATSLQALAFGTLTSGTTTVQASSATAAGAQTVLVGTTLVPATSTYHVPVGGLGKQVLFIDTGGTGFDSRGLLFARQLPNAPRGAVTASVVVAAGTSGQVQRIDFSGDGGSVQTAMPITQAITGTGPLGDLTLLSTQGLVADVTAPGIVGNIEVTNGPISGTIQTTDATEDLGRVLTDASSNPTGTTTIHTGGAFSGEIISRGNLVSRVVVDGPASGVIAAQGDIGAIRRDSTGRAVLDSQGHLSRLGGLSFGGPFSGQVVALGNLFGDLTVSNSSQDGRVAVKGRPVSGLAASRIGILGNVTIAGATQSGAIISGGLVGDAAGGTTVSASNFNGLIAARGDINFGTFHLGLGGTVLESVAIPLGNPNAAAIDAVFTNNGQPLRFDITGLDLAGLELILQDVREIHVGSNGNLTGVDGTSIVAFQNRSVTGIVTEGSVATVRGTIVEPDPQGVFTLTVNWGDGTPIETFTFPPGSDGRQVTVNHRYAVAGSYTIHLAWHDQTGAGNRADMPVVVNNVPPVVDGGPDANLHVGGMLERKGTFSDPGTDTWTATVDYGDGSGPQTLKLGPDMTFHLHHKYSDAGTFVVTVTVRDGNGGVGVDQFAVVVDD
jgi:hypothetical protein